MIDASVARAGRYGRAAVRWARLLAGGKADRRVVVFYGHDRVPAPGERAAGGTVKIQKLAARFPNTPVGFSLLYLGTTWLPRDLGPLLALVRRRGIPLVVNQDGVGYPGWAGARTDEVNRPLRRALLAADHVLYQSEFSKRSADRFLGEPSGGWEILPNAVDIERFVPAGDPPDDGPVLLLGGDQTQAYRVELALRTLRVLHSTHPDARLLVTGRVVVDPAPLIAELGLRAHVELLGEYDQHDAPSVLRRAHVLLHTKMQDPCPTLVLEAMACGLPIAYAASGGTVELVGDAAGVGVPHLATWEREVPPDPEAMAEAVDRVLGDLRTYSAAARARAVGRFALTDWLERHTALFTELVQGDGAPR